MSVGVWILGDQLSLTGAALLTDQLAANGSTDSRHPVIFIESLAHVRIRPYHQQKLVLIWSAMRHFAADLTEQGYAVEYCEAEEFEKPLRSWIKKTGITELRVMAPVDKPFAQLLKTLDLPCQLTILPNNQFLWTEIEFCEWAGNRKRLLMEDFYRECRKRYGILMTDAGKPIGDRWNFDQENRKPPKKNDPNFNPPTPQWFEPDALTRSVMDKVRNLDMPTYGELEPFGWAVTRSQALQVLDTFITTRLETFGPYQDAMVTGEYTMWHALISPYINTGLLHPLEVVQAVEQAYVDRDLDLNCVEGLIRQVIGWREYMRGVYAFSADDYADSNWFEHTRPLPEFFWDASQAKMNCLRQCLEQTERTGYAHHIQRLMILSNFALVAGISPQAIENWFHAAYIDAYDWVMQTNVLGMGQYADGGTLASKPYASSANYINKMSDYCKGCQYDHKSRTGKNACPFNYFYWDFLDRHREKLTKQGRMSFILKNLDRMTTEELTDIRNQAQSWQP
jgi:deoxyribodipyrimidine photolyase-related protein